MSISAKCECAGRTETEINSLSCLGGIKDFFEQQVEEGVFIALEPQKPYFRSDGRKWFADVWYKCRECGCLWEVIYPDFPACGRVRKFPDGIYRPY